MHIHILGICGTFMGGIARLARELGHVVTGSDENIYPPMSTQMEALGVELMEGYSANHLQPAPDLVIIGNAMSRGNVCVEYLLDAGMNYISGPQWLAEQVLHGRHVLAVAGTHGKTTTTSILTWILEEAGKEPGFLIGGVAENFGISSRLGGAGPFVIEADEYDTAFFDKRSKFIHYRPRTLIINNIEFDHADIFPDIAAIKRQFHHLIRTIPASGRIIAAADDEEIDQLMQMGCWTPEQRFGIDSGDWCLEAWSPDYSEFTVSYMGKKAGTVEWSLIGRHNAMNGLAAIAAANAIGVDPLDACSALLGFRNVKRRLECLGCVNGVTVYDDFAHHPTAIASTLAALRSRVGDSGRIVALLEPRSNTMRMGVHRDTLAPALMDADMIWIYQPPGLDWDLSETFEEISGKSRIFTEINPIIEMVSTLLKSGDHLLIMSNGGFQGIHRRILQRLQA